MKSCVRMVVLLASVSLATVVTQNSWEGGPGEAGPVTSWGTEFFTSTDVDFEDAGLKLYEGERNTVSSDFIGAISVFGIDMDNDGDIDMLGAATDAEDVTWWENIDGSGTAWIEHLIVGDYSGVRSVFAADVDGDNDIDVLGAASLLYGSRDVTWWENTNGSGTVWIEHTIEGSFYGARSVFGADIDGDNDLDVFAAASYRDEILWWENIDGAGTAWTVHTVTDQFNGASGVYVVDLDGDNDLDVLGSAIIADDVMWWENVDGSGTRWMEHPIDYDFNCPVSLFAADVDDDDDMDIVGAAALADDVVWWENQDGSAGAWIKHVIDGEFDAAYSVYAADMDADNDIDVLGAAYIADDITWWENADGSGASWVEHTINGDFEGAASLHVADVNGDGDNDVMGVAHFEDEITWWDIVGYGDLGVLESSILDAGDVVKWDGFFSSSLEPAGTSVGFQFRSSHDSSNMGAWSDTVFAPDTSLSGILADSTRYLQYRVILETSDQTVSPELSAVTFSCTMVGVGESPSIEVSSWSFQILENPSCGFFSALLSIPETGLVQLSLYDVSGRQIADASQEFSAGTHEVNFSGLAEGVYFCVMTAGEFTSIERAVFLK